MPTASSNVRVRGQSGKHMLVLSSSQFDPERTFERVLPNSDLALVNTISVISPLNRVLTPGLWAHNVAGPKSPARTRLGRRFFGVTGLAVPAGPCLSGNRNGSTLGNDGQAPTGEMAVTPPSIRKSAPTTYAESSDAR